MDSLRDISERVESASLSDGETVWSYAELRCAAAAWNARLVAVDARVVAYDLPNGLERAALDIALLDSDRVAVPIPDFFSSAQRAHLMKVSGADVLISHAQGNAGDQTHDRPRWNVSNVHCTRPSAAPTLPPGTAVVTFTSGSTGTPKGVCLARDTLLDTARSLCDSLQNAGIRRHLCLLPLSLLLENVAGLYANLLNGSEIRLPDTKTLGLRGSSGLDMPAFIAGLQRHRPDSVILVPALLLALTSATEFGLNPESSLQYIAVGGGKVSSALLRRAEAVGLSVYEGYGLTECGSVLAVNTPAARRMGTVGPLLPHVDAFVERGELIVRRPVMLGYAGDESPCLQSTPVRTGDLVELADGFLTISGRSKAVFITAFGRNVSPEWIESELQTELCIAHALVVGEGAPACAALIVPRGDADDATLQAALQRVNARLPDYAQIADWRRLSNDSIEAMTGLTPNGRLKRDAVAAHEAARLDTMLQNIRFTAHTGDKSNRAKL